MSYQLPLSTDELEARLSMPQTAEGFVMSLFYVPPGQREALESQWREWARGKPKHLHPSWFPAWAEHKRAQAATR